ncbi:MAG TPA: 4Fe-4S binding protein [Geminicoccaceae bacterium]|nr:4Fe-4S binding protein [Geminicoccaceae bacterium]
MNIGDRHCLLCDCERTMELDGSAIARTLGAGGEPVIHTQLCRAQLDRYQAALATGRPLMVACTQEAPLFAELAEEAGSAPVLFTNIRERAGWSVEGTAAQAKIAALLAEAAVPVPPAPVLALHSAGRCLVYGPGEAALEAARRLADRLSVTLLLSAPEAELLPLALGTFPILMGRIGRLSGHLGAFAAEVAGLRAAAPSSRGRLRFLPPAAETGTLEADIVLDLSGGAPLVTAPEKRDGYLRADPRDPLRVAAALFEATGLTGEFEKPRYIAFTEELCAHSRSRRTGCTRCLDLCPTGAITPAGDHVAIDAHVCAGCGACAGVCPTGAAAYASPDAGTVLTRLRTLLGTWHAAGGGQPVLLVHEARHGEEMIALSARLGRGLPAHVLPFALGELARLDLEELAGAFAYGAARVVLLVPPRKTDEVAGLRATAGYVRTVLDALGYGADRLVELVADDPDELEEALWSLAPAAPVPAAGYLPMGGKRGLMRLALDHLHSRAPSPVDVVALPAGAPLGRIVVDTGGCTLCLACVGACPTGALRGDPDRPAVRFVEDACVQCGLCESTCPERVIRLEPRLSFLPEAKQPVTFKEEEPACCVRCGKVFGTRSSIDRIVQRLGERHPMFKTPAQIELIRMCDNCRIVAQMGRDGPLAGPARPAPRTTDDYLRARARPDGDGA